MKIKFVIVVLIFVMLLVSGCKECKVSSDCNSRVSKDYSSYSTKCLDVACVNNKCEIDVITNCCGNRRCEANAGENKCLCEKDCGKCSGKGEIKIGSRTYDTEYLEYGCKDNECALIMDDSLIRGIDLIHDREFSYFKIGITSSLDQPFNIDSSKFKVKIQLEDTNEHLVLPVVITSLKLIERELMIGEKEFDGTLNGVGDYFTESIPINEDCMQNIEEEKRPSLVIDYTYIIEERTGHDSEGNPIYENKVKRETYTKSYSSKLFFVNPEK